MKKPRSFPVYGYYAVLGVFVAVVAFIPARDQKWAGLAVGAVITIASLVMAFLTARDRRIANRYPQPGDPGARKPWDGTP